MGVLPDSVPRDLEDHKPWPREFPGGPSSTQEAMKTNVRNSNLKRKKMTGYRYRMKTKGGRKVIKARRRRGRSLSAH